MSDYSEDARFPVDVIDFPAICHDPSLLRVLAINDSDNRLYKASRPD
jgi:hypothetical protein